MKIRIPTAVRPFRLITADIRSLRQRYVSDWTTFNQLVFASAVYVFFTNLLPGITFASDLYVLTGKSWGTIEVVLSTGLCGIVFALCVRNIAADTLPPTPTNYTNSSSQQVLTAASNNLRSDRSFLCASGEYLFLLHYIISCKFVNFLLFSIFNRPFTIQPLFTTKCLDSLSSLHGLVSHSCRMDALHPCWHKCSRLDDVLRDHFLHRNLFPFK